MPSREDIAQSYGWELSVINSSSELKRLFNQAAFGPNAPWTNEKFAAELRDTRFFKRHSESWRRAYILEHGADKGEWRKMHHQMWVNLRDVAQQMGAVISSKLMSRIAKIAVYNGWNEGEIRNHIAHYVKFVGGRPFGDAASTTMQLRATALNNGYPASTSQLQTWARQVAAGVSTVDSLQNWMRYQAARDFPTFAAELKAGMDLKDLAAPYTQSMATLWEMNPSEITMRDPTIRRALAGAVDPKTHTRTAMSTTDFEDLLRKNPRALKTQWMQDASTSNVHDLLRLFRQIAA